MKRQKDFIYKRLCRKIKKCHRCSLYKFRTKTVAGEGSLNTKIIFIGEAPGAEEDRKGQPFCGPAGKILDQLLDSINLDRKKIFITNLVKCHPPKNRPPKLSEIKACSIYLKQQLKIINPKLIVLLGRLPLKRFLNKELISQNHGKIFKQEKFIIIPLYHPAAALYQRRLYKILKKDFKKVKNSLKEIL